jgi:hypothetical protein
MAQCKWFDMRPGRPAKKGKSRQERRLFLFWRLVFSGGAFLMGAGFVEAGV